MAANQGGQGGATTVSSKKVKKLMAEALRYRVTVVLSVEEERAIEEVGYLAQVLMRLDKFCSTVIVRPLGGGDIGKHW